MKSVILGFFVTIITFAASAETTVLKLDGKGIDGTACSVMIEKEGKKITKLEIIGATKMFEIIAETNKGYLPSTRITSYGGRDMTDLMKDMVTYFKPNKNIFAAANSYVLDTNDIPKNGDQESLGMLKMRVTMSMSLDVETKELTEIRIVEKMKAALITLASSDFICKR